MSGGQWEIRTLGGVTLAGFQNRCIRPGSANCPRVLYKRCLFWRRHPDSNWGSRFCKPMPYHLATAPTVLNNNGARSRTWTGTVLLPGDFKSPASTNFAIRAYNFLPLYYVSIKLNGAGDEVRTRDPNLGKVVLYHWATPAHFFCWAEIIAGYFLNVKPFWKEFQNLAIIS